MVGIDLSPKIIEKARRLDRGYTRLLVGDLDETLPLRGQHDELGAEPFDLVLCTDTFVYYGDLAAVFQLVAKRMRGAEAALFRGDQVAS